VDKEYHLADLGFGCFDCSDCGIVYCAKRLHRYRNKYHEEREAVDRMQEEVDEMEMFGGKAGRKDDEIAMMDNPLVLQMKDMQARLDKNALEIEEAKIKEKEEESEGRQGHIMNLKEDRNSLQAELDRLKSMLNEQDAGSNRTQLDAVATDYSSEVAVADEPTRNDFSSASSKPKTRRQMA